MIPENFDMPTDTVHKRLLVEEADARKDSELLDSAAAALGILRFKQIDKADAPYSIFGPDDAHGEAHLHNEAKRSAVWRLRCFLDPSLPRPSGYVGYLTREDIKDAIATLKKA